MTEIVRKPGVTVVDGVEHPDAVWRCACGFAVRFEAFRTPPDWCEMTIEIGTLKGVPKRQKKIFCPPCARSVLSGGQVLPQLSQQQRLVLPANTPWKPPWRK